MSNYGASRRHVDFALGGQIGGRQNFVHVESQLWIVLGDPNQPHGVPPHIPGPDNMVQGSSFVFINSIPVCREGHLAGCLHPTTGSKLVYLSD